MRHGFFEQLLHEMSVIKMAPYSRINHHADGVDYLCLHRSDELTVKLYLIEEPVNQNGNGLVNPHSHRYAFQSVVLHGSLIHATYRQKPGGYYDRFIHNPDQDTLTTDGSFGLQRTLEPMVTGDSYFILPQHIHTLRMIPKSGPVLIGIAQFRDTRRTSHLYIPTGKQMLRPDTRIPTVGELFGRKLRCLDLLSGVSQS